MFAWQMVCHIELVEFCLKMLKDSSGNPLLEIWGMELNPR